MPLIIPFADTIALFKDIQSSSFYNIAFSADDDKLNTYKNEIEKKEKIIAKMDLVK